MVSMTHALEMFLILLLPRYLPESMILERSLKTDRQVEAAVDLVKNKSSFDKILAKGSRYGEPDATTTLKVASTERM